MEKYEISEVLGQGAFGTVSKAINLNTKEVVAIKEFKKKFYSFEECKSLREIKSLGKLNNHENIIKILEMIYKEDKTLLVIMDYMKENLYELMKSRTIKKFSEGQIKYIMYEVIKGIAYMHRYSYFHRDLKPENILVNGDKVKIADFGLAREIRSVPPYTDYVSTRWYRAPECLLKSTNYNSPVDIWALGCIMIELYNLKPIFPGNTEKDTLFKICGVLGVPDSNSPNIMTLSKKIDFKFPVNIAAGNLSSMIPDASREALDFLSQMLQWDPGNRATASSLLNHSFFTKVSIPDRLLTPENVIFNSTNTKKFGSNIRRPQKKKFDEVSSSVNDGFNSIVDDDISKMLEDTQDFNKCKVYFF